MSSDSDASRRVGADRVLAVLVKLADFPEGATLEQLASEIDGTKPTVHRALGALRRARLASQVSRGRYVLGDEFIRLALRHVNNRPEAERIVPALRRLVEIFGETAHYAVLDQLDVVYRAKVDPPVGTVRLTSEVGGRNPAYCTAVGKLLLAYELDSLEGLKARLGSLPLMARTPTTITDVDRLWLELQDARARGYALDNQENEIGVNCIALPVGLETVGKTVGAVSLSALSFRTPLVQLIDRIETIREIVSPL